MLTFLVRRCGILTIKNEQWCTRLFASYNVTAIEAALARLCIRLALALDSQSFASTTCAWTVWNKSSESVHQRNAHLGLNPSLFPECFTSCSPVRLGSKDTVEKRDMANCEENGHRHRSGQKVRCMPQHCQCTCHCFVWADLSHRRYHWSRATADPRSLCLTNCRSWTSVVCGICPLFKRRQGYRWVGSGPNVSDKCI